VLDVCGGVDGVAFGLGGGGTVGITGGRNLLEIRASGSESYDVRRPAGALPLVPGICGPLHCYELVLARARQLAECAHFAFETARFWARVHGSVSDEPNTARLESWVVTGYTTAGRPFARLVEADDAYWWPRDVPNGVIQTTRRAVFTHDVVSLVVLIIQGGSTVSTLRRFTVAEGDADEAEDAYVSLNLNQLWGFGTKVWLATYLNHATGSSLNFNHMTSLRKRPEVSILDMDCNEFIGKGSPRCGRSRFRASAPF